MRKPFLRRTAAAVLSASLVALALVPFSTTPFAFADEDTGGGRLIFPDDGYYDDYEDDYYYDDYDYYDETPASPEPSTPAPPKTTAVPNKPASTPKTSKPVVIADDAQVTTGPDSDAKDEQADEPGEDAEKADDDEDKGISPLSVEVPDGDSNYHMPDPGRPYLKFKINDPVTNQPITKPGSTVTIQGPRSGSISDTADRWNNTVTVLDCVSGEDSCGANSLDQDSRPGHFAVDRLTGGANAAQLSSTSRYRLGAGPTTGTPIGYQWTTSAPANQRDDSAGITAGIAWVSAGTTQNPAPRNTAAAGEWVSTPNPSGAGSNMVHDFLRSGQTNLGSPVLRLAPYLTWTVLQSGTPVGGATVRVQGHRTGTGATAWGTNYDVPDCTSDPCAVDSMDQNPAPGQFTVYNLRTAAGAVTAVNSTGNGRYRLQLASSTAPLNLQWVDPNAEYQQTQGSGNATVGSWSTDANGASYFNFSTPLAVQAAPSLVWQVTQNGTPVAGATVRVERPNGSNWPSGTGGTANSFRYDVVDCTSDPCGANSMDQDPAPGKFQVYNLTASINASTPNPAAISNTSSYRIQPQTPAPNFTAWLTSTTTWLTIGSIANPGWSSNNPPIYNFGSLLLREASALIWEVRHQDTNDLVGGATVQIRGPRASSSDWGTVHTVTDCIEAPCHPDSMDQDPTPGKFKVFSLGIGDNFNDRSWVTAGSRYSVAPFGSPFGTQWVTATDWINIPGQNTDNTNTSQAWPAATSTAEQQWTFQPLIVREGAYLTWEVKDQNGQNVGGATVEVQAGTGTTEWGNSYYVTDCTADPCHPESMDQDPEPGKFRVDTLRGLDGSTQTAVDVNRQRYRITPRGSIVEHTWTTAPGTWQAVNLSNWPTGDRGYAFPNPLLAQTGRVVSDFCSAPTDGRYYTLSRASSTSASSTIRQLAPTRNTQGVETGISTTNNLVANSAKTLIGAGQIANALGVTNTGIFYFTGQVSGSSETARNTTVYRFDPKIDTEPYPVFNMDLLSPTTGTVVSGDAMIYQGREEFYFAYYSDSPVQLQGQTAIRFHLYRYSHGNGDRTGEVRHVDVPRWSGGGTVLNGDFAFDAQGNLQFIISSSEGRVSSGVVNANDFLSWPSAHVLPDVSTIVGTANLVNSATTSLAAINGIVYTKSGRVILQRNAGITNTSNNNYVADMPSFSNQSTARTFGPNAGYFVDLASCDAPTTVTVKKEVIGARYNANDQFTLKATRQVSGQADEEFASATTTGNEGGVQHEMVGPFVTTLQGTFHASEEFTQNNDRYETAYECSVVGASVPFLSKPFASDGSTLNLSFSLENTPGIGPGSQVECTFKNRRYASDLKVSKTSEPPTGTSVNVDDTIRYILTFDNSTGSASARDIDYVDWLRDVLDDADVVPFDDGDGGSHLFEYRSDLNGGWSSTPAAAPGAIVAHGDASSIASTQKISITGQVPTHAIRQVSFQVKVKANDAERDATAGPQQGYLLRNYLTPVTTTAPPETCVIPALPGLPLCTEHPIKAWTIRKDSQPSDMAMIHSGGNVYYRVKVTNYSGEDLKDITIQDDLTQTLAASVWDRSAPDAVLTPNGISYYDADDNFLAQGIVWAAGAAAPPGEEILPKFVHTDWGHAMPTGRTCSLQEQFPGVEDGEQTPERFTGCWTMTTQPFNIPATYNGTPVAYAIVGYAIRAGSPATPEDPEVPLHIQVESNAQWVNTVQGTAGTFGEGEERVWPNRCSAADGGIPPGWVPPEGEYMDPNFDCKTGHTLNESYFHIWKKDGSLPDGNENNNLEDATFLLADTRQDAIEGNPSRWLCRADNLVPDPYDPHSIPSAVAGDATGASAWGYASSLSGGVHWSIAEANRTRAAYNLENPGAPVDLLPQCGLFFYVDGVEVPNEGQATGTWRSRDMRGGDLKASGYGPLDDWRSASAPNVSGEPENPGNHPNGDIYPSGMHGTYWLVETKSPTDFQLLSQPMKMWVAPAAPAPGGLSPMTQQWYDYQGRLSLPVVGVGEDGSGGSAMPNPDGTSGSDNTAIRVNCANPWSAPANNQPNCIMPTGWTMPVFDVKAPPLPLAGGVGTGQLLVGGLILLMTSAAGAVWWTRRRRDALSAAGGGSL